jgi:hypothetical protein
VPEGWIKGNKTEKKMIVGRRNVSHMQTEKAIHNMRESKILKKQKNYYNPTTLEERGFGWDEIIPEGWIKGKSPKNINTGWKQSNNQKSRVKETMQGVYRIIMEDGTEHLLIGRDAVTSLLGGSMSQIRYAADNGKINKFGAKSFEALGKACFNEELLNKES